jgi:hypothetical protein
VIEHIYPLYRIFKVIKCLPEKLARSAMKGPLAQDLKRIVAFWTEFGFFSLAEFFIDFPLFFISMYSATSVYRAEYSAQEKIWHGNSK